MVVSVEYAWMDASAQLTTSGRGKLTTIFAGEDLKQIYIMGYTISVVGFI